MKTNFFPRLLGRILLLLPLLFAAFLAVAQAPEAAPEMADGLRASGKIYVVVAVVVVIISGLLFYLISLDRKVGRLEQEIKR